MKYILCHIVLGCAILVSSAISQEDYRCVGYGGMFNGNLSVGASNQVLVADLPNSYGNTDIRIMFRKPVFDSVPQCSLSKRPCVVFVHGGGWVATGSMDAWKFMSDSLSRFFVPDGFISASVKYRLGIGGGNEVLFLNNAGCLINPLSDVTNAVGRAAHDVQVAVQYIRANAEALGIDTANIFLFGVSAGAYNVINAAYVETGEKLYNWTMPQRARVKGVIGYAGAIVDTTILSAADPKVPLLLVHGTCDRVVPFGAGRVLQCSDAAPFQFNVYGSDVLHRRAQSLDIPVQLHAICGADHDAGTTDISTVFYSICRIRNWMASLLYNEKPATYKEYRSLLASTCGAPTCLPILCRDSIDRFFTVTSVAESSPANVTKMECVAQPQSSSSVVRFSGKSIAEGSVLEVYSGTGRQCGLYRLHANAELQTIGDLPSGIYLLMLRSAGGEVVAQTTHIIYH